MSLETPNRIHASAVCFWELTATFPPSIEDLYAVGFLSRNNFRTIELLGGPSVPGVILLRMVRGVGKNQAVCMLLPTAVTEVINAGAIVGAPGVETMTPFDDAGPNDVTIANLPPPERLTGAGGAAVGDRETFYVMILEVPPTPEFLAPLGAF